MPHEISEDVAHRAEARARHLGGGVVDLLRHARDLRRLVADALEVGHGLAHRHDEAQVGGRRLPAHDDVAQVVVDRDLELVHLRIGRDHLVDARDVAVDVAVDRHADLGLHEAAHLHHARADGFEVLVVLFRDMFGHGGACAE
jgi:hypothetical protein